MSQFYNFETIIQAVPSRIDAICQELYPEGKKKSDNWCVGDLDGTKGQSFQISLKQQSAGCFIDRSDMDVRGNIFALVAMKKGLSYREAGEWLAKFCSVTPEQKFERKKRPVPVLKKEELKKLSKNSIDFAASRGITEETLSRLKIVSMGRAIVMPHFDDESNLAMLKYWPTDGSKKIWTNKDPIHTLFAKELIDPIKSGGEIIICEGHWDAMTWIQLGFHAVSIPSGAENDNWIEEDWVFLSQFTTIYLNFDNDKAGIEADSRVKKRLGQDRCRTIKLEQKDANQIFQDKLDHDILRKAYKAARDAPVEHIVDPATIKHSVQESLSGTGSAADVPFFLSGMSKLQFRPHEATLWFGYTGHGKSTAIMNQFAYQAGQGVSGMIASFEDNPTVNYATMLKQYAASAEIGAAEEYDAVYDDLTSKILLFDSMRRTSPKVMIETMIRAHKQLGICHFAVDNVMTMDVDRQDNTKQAEVADQFRVFVSTYPIHLHIAAHPRKPMDTTMIKPPQIADVRGASEWGDMSQNAISVYRDVKKAERVAEMRDQKFSEQQIAEFAVSCPDGKFVMRKQRTTGDLPVAGFRFAPDIKRFHNNEADLGRYFSATLLPGAEEVEEEEYPF